MDPLCIVRTVEAIAHLEVLVKRFSLSRSFIWFLAEQHPMELGDIEWLVSHRTCPNCKSIIEVAFERWEYNAMNPLQRFGKLMGRAMFLLFGDIPYKINQAKAKLTREER